MKVIDIINEAKKPLFTFELLPPVTGSSIDRVFKTISVLKEYDPAYINFTYHREEVIYRQLENGLAQRCVVRRRAGTIGLAAAVKNRYHIEVVPHIICGGAKADEIEAALVELNFLGIDNVFALRGDPPRGEKRFVPQPGGFTHATELVEQIANMNQGVYLDSGLKEPFPTRFCIGVAGYPEKHIESPNMEDDISWLKKKVELGAEYIVTQMFFLNERYFEFVQACRDAGITVPIIPGIKPITALSDIDLLPQTFSIDLPEQLVMAVRSCRTNKEAREVGVEFAIQQSKELVSRNVPGIHYYTLGKASSTARIVKEVF